MGVVGLVTAMELATKHRDEFHAVVTAERRRFEERLDDVAERTVPEEASSPHHSHLRLPGISNETMLVRLDRRGLAASSASACQSGAATVSHVLTAMGYGADEARECLRFSFGWTTRPGDGDRAADIVLDAIEGLR